jgi:hypothetical protein
MVTLDTTKFKLVKIIYSPGGLVINYQGLTGLIFKPIVLSVELIEKLVKQKAIVVELKEDGTEVSLTTDNYNTDNGGIAVEDTAQIPANIEAEHITERQARQEARIADIGDYWRDYYELRARLRGDIVGPVGGDPIDDSGDDEF